MTMWNGLSSTRPWTTGWPKYKTMDHRLAEITAWLRENKLFAGDPEEMGSVERAYWHFGYLSALQDMRAVLAQKKRTNN